MGNDAVNIGSIAPEFALPDQDSVIRKLSDYRDKCSVVLFFYPKDYTPICTLESIAFRDSYQEFQSVGAEIIGVSSDPPVSHSSFCDAYQLPFRLLTDEANRVRDRYGANSLMGDFGSRVTYVIDREGIVRSVYRSALRAKKHVQSSLEVASALHGTQLDFLRK